MDALMAIINRPSTDSKTQDYIQEVHTGFGGMGVGADGNRNDRGAALLLVANLENSMRIAIEGKLSTAERHRAMLFDGEVSPFGTFSRKIRMGYALRLFGDETRSNLEIIRRIRNVFAHAPCPLHFSTVEVVNACALLKVPAPVGAAEDQKHANTTGRERFTLVCERTEVALRNTGTARESDWERYL